jgi:hypothetical protein
MSLEKKRKKKYYKKLTDLELRFNIVRIRRESFYFLYP